MVILPLIGRSFAQSSIFKIDASRRRSIPGSAQVFPHGGQATFVCYRATLLQLTQLGITLVLTKLCVYYHGVREALLYLVHKRLISEGAIAVSGH